ncbi:MAG: extracellular solute-binding protein, partial [Candidatus Cloacimonetes bacterium]|nr:extracellular solute-binding protein [Candidatus Cloacimonadota bacterium]
MKRTKKLIAFFFVAVLAISIAFANGTAEKETAGKKQVISLWCGWPALEDIFTRAKADYEAENPNVEVEISTMNLRDFEQKLAVSLPAGSGPDIFITSEYIVPMYVNAGLVATPPDNISDFVNANFDSLVKSVNQFKGPNDNEARIYGVPHIGIARVQYCNKDVMAEAGLDPEKAPQTWDELLDDASKIVKYDQNGNITRSGISLRIFGGGSGIGEKFMIKLVQAGGSFLGRTADGGWKANYNTEAGVDALGF